MTAHTANARHPRLISRVSTAAYDLLMTGVERQLFGPYRRRLLGACRGRVLDVGAGTGANLAHYPRQGIGKLVLLDPSPGMLARAGRKARALGLTLHLQQGQAEQMPLEDNSFDTVVFTLSLCTIADLARALAEAGRVLRPKGRLLVMEHVRA